MAGSAFKDQTTLAVVIEFCAFIGVASLALFIYMHRRALSSLRRAFRSRSVATTSSNSPGDQGQLTHQDLEKGVYVPSSGQPTDSDADSDPHTRVFTYLCGLPLEANDYMTMREISAEGDNGGRASSVGGCSEESGDSNWIEIINNFPPPPDVDLVRSLHAGSTSMNALGFVFDDPGAGGFPGNNSVISSSGTSEVATLGSHSQQTVVAAPDSSGRSITEVVEAPNLPLSEASNEHFTPGS